MNSCRCRSNFRVDCRLGQGLYLSQIALRKNLFIGHKTSPSLVWGHFQSTIPEPENSHGISIPQQSFLLLGICESQSSCWYYFLQPKVQRSSSILRVKGGRRPSITKTVFDSVRDWMRFLCPPLEQTYHAISSLPFKPTEKLETACHFIFFQDKRMAKMNQTGEKKRVLFCNR